MIELYLSKVTESSETEMAGKMYARVSYKQTMDLHDMAHHMAEHNTAFSEGLIVGVLTDFVKCVREMVLNGQSTGDFTREELKKDVKFSWTDKTKADIATAKGETTESGGSGGGNTGGGPSTEG